MPYATIDPKHTGLLFFDTLGSGYKATEEQKVSLQPVVANYVRLRTVAKEVGLPVFYTQADHRPDRADAARQYSDINMRTGKPWPNPEEGFWMAADSVRGGDWTSEIIEEIKPDP